MNKEIKSALISVFYKDGLEQLVSTLHQFGVSIYSTGGTAKFISDLGIPCIDVEQITGYPSILGGRVKTLHPAMFGGILGRRSVEQDIQEMNEFQIPEIDLVAVDLYPFEETVANTTDESLIIEKIDIGGPSMMRAAAKNHQDVLVISDKNDYQLVSNWLKEQNGKTSLDQRRQMASKAFNVVMNYDIAISNYFNGQVYTGLKNKNLLRYGENPHQNAVFFGNLEDLFEQLNGKALSYNNLVDLDAACQLIQDLPNESLAIIKHTNACGIACRSDAREAWKAALAGDPESAFGGVIITNHIINLEVAKEMNELFFEVLVAPKFDDDALSLLKSKKNRILLKINTIELQRFQFKSVLGGTLWQEQDLGNFQEWIECGGRESNESEKSDLIFANIICKHLKSNAIVLVKNKQMLGKGAGQTSRIDALRHAVEKAKQFSMELSGSVMASDAFFPFDDCVKLGYEAGVSAFIQPGGSIRDQDSIDFCKTNNLSMVLTKQRHFKH